MKTIVFLVISCSVYLEWEMCQTKVVENQNTHFVLSNFFKKLCHLLENMEKYSRDRQATGDNMVHTHCMLLQMYTQNM